MALNQPSGRAWGANILVFVGATVLMNGLIFGLGWMNSTNYAPTPRWAPPDAVVGFVWSAVLFPMMATARWLMNSKNGVDAMRARASTTLLLISCVLWPLYSLALGSLIGGLVGNIWTIALAVFVTARLWPLSKTAALCVCPVILWVTFATTIVLHQLRWLF